MPSAKESAMFHDILIPCRIGNYYLYKKRILSFEITPMMVSGLLIEFVGRDIKIKNQQSIILKDFSTQAQTSALKKIASTIGAYDEIVTTLSSSTVIYKELELPFIGHDALQMIVAYEVESLLPFSLEDAVIDFMITAEDLEKKQSKLLVAAVRKEDLQNHVSLFEKAELEISTITIDIFALCRLYQNGLVARPIKVEKPSAFFDVKSSSIITLWHNVHAKIFKKPLPQVTTSSTLEFQPKEAEVLIDIGFDVIRVLYFQNGQLCTMRMIPTGMSDIAQNISQKTAMAYYDVMQIFLTTENTETIALQFHDEFKNLFEEINRTFLFFEKQEASSYLQPHKIWLSGFATQIAEFQAQAQAFFGVATQIISTDSVLHHLKITNAEKHDSISFLALAFGLFVHFDQNVNFLKTVAQKSDTSLLNKQLVTIALMTSLCLGATFWRSYIILQDKESIYLASKKQFAQAIEQNMRIDLKNEKSIKIILEKAEEKLKTEKTLWFAFSAQQECSVLEYLQDLSIKIDRQSIGLQVKQMHLDYEKVSMTGTVKDFNALDVFEEELASLQLLQLVEKPRELSFTINFKPKEPVKGNKS
jgi:Tfp pilus assembly PilM family ATPase